MRKASLILSGLVVLFFLSISASRSYAFPTYSQDENATNCRRCHGSFYRNNYVSTSDGQSWSNIHNLHRFVILEEEDAEVSKCHVCHMPGRPEPPVHLNESGSEYLDPISCVGCHGRYEDIGNDNRSDGIGSGLRQHHSNAGIGVCMSCHADANPLNYTPVGENTHPPHYFTPDDVFTNKPTDSCNAFGEENYAGIWKGLDNNGDGVYDILDSNCKPPAGKLMICHLPPGKPNAGKTVSVNTASLGKHLAHGDVDRACEDLFSGADMARGGRLYDEFWAIAGSQPTMDHPFWAMQTSNTRSGGDTWRCKECHGWDYKGAAGAYGSGSHYTGFPGIFGSTLTPEEVVQLLADPKGHNYLSQGLKYGDLWDLARFVIEGQINTDDILTGDQFTGDPGTGQILFEDDGGDNPGGCAACHNNDGLRTPPYSSTDADFSEFPQVIATENPWEFQHKVRFGHPGTAMRGIVIYAGDAEDTNNIGAHTQQNLSLP